MLPMGPGRIPEPLRGPAPCPGGVLLAFPRDISQSYVFPPRARVACGSASPVPTGMGHRLAALVLHPRSRRHI
jgi:hypothetical protein